MKQKLPTLESKRRRKGRGGHRNTFLHHIHLSLLLVLSLVSSREHASGVVDLNSNEQEEKLSLCFKQTAQMYASHKLGGLFVLSCPVGSSSYNLLTYEMPLLTRNRSMGSQVSAIFFI